MTPETARNAYASPPPTNRKPLPVPPTPKASDARKSPRYVNDSRHETYSAYSSEDELAVRVKRNKSRSVPDVLELSDSDLPPTISTPRKLEFKSTKAGQVQGSRGIREDDENSDGDLDGFVVPDDDTPPPRRRSNKRRPVSRSRSPIENGNGDATRPVHDLDAGRSEGRRRASDSGTTAGQAVDMEPPTRKSVIAKTEGGKVMELNIKGHARSSAVNSREAGSSRPLVKDGKCRITDYEGHGGFLDGTFDNCFAYLSGNILHTPQETGAVSLAHLDTVVNGFPLFDKENLSIDRLKSVMTISECANGKVVVASRVSPEVLSTSKYTTANNKTVVNLVRDGDVVDVVIFAFVAVDGSYMIRLDEPSGERAPLNRAYHSLNVYPLAEDYKRSLAFFHYIFAPVNQKCQMFTRGNAWQAASMWGERDKYKGRKQLPDHVRTNAGEGSSARASRGVNPALSRISKNFMADIPVFDSRKHFLLSHVGEDWRDGFDPENILTQVDTPDDRFTEEIPDDSLVALHCIVSMRGTGTVSLNLIGAQVLVTPRGVYHSDL
ncbi:unnamed protein product [Peniophora sp. CBMAI 1063]|nr:unnamed protein product [Peniophora sp. CBMAI 1063]